MTSNVFLPKADAPDVKLDVLRGSKPAVGDIRRVFGSDITEPVISIEPLGRSTFHFIYSVVTAKYTYILRTRASRTFPADEFTIDLGMYSRFKKRLPIPCVHTVDLSRMNVPFDYEILDRAPGVWVYDWIKKHYAAVVFEDLGHVIAQLHRIRTKGFGRLDPRTLAGRKTITGKCSTWISYLTLYLTDEINFLLNHHIMTREMGKKAIAVIHTAGVFRVTPVLLHGDLANQNVYTEGTHVTALTDWEDALSGDPVYDLAYFISGCYEHKEWSDPFIKGYTSVRSLPVDFDRKFWLYWVRVSIAKAVSQIRWKVGQPDSPEDLRMRITYGLSRFFAG